MSKLVEIICSTDPAVRNKSLNHVCKTASIDDLLDELHALETFRKSAQNLYEKVRALFFLYAIHRFYIPLHKDISTTSHISFEAYEHLLKRRFEEAIEIFIKTQEIIGPNDGISSGLAEAYHKLAFQTLADQVRKSVRTTPGNQWMFRVGHPGDHPLQILRHLCQPDCCTGLFPIIHETTPVRMDISHSGWSDIFFLGMDFPEGAKVLNISVDLALFEGEQNTPCPPIDTFFRIIDEPVIKLCSIDLGVNTTITKIDDIFDFAKDYLGLLKAALIASGMVPPGMEGCGISLKQLLEQLIGPKKGFELVSQVNNIPKGSRLAVSTNLLASLIAVCMRVTGQTDKLTGPLSEKERRLVAARAILGEWIGGSGGGWQDSGGVWPGIKLIKGVEAIEGDSEYQVSRGRLLPQHTVLTEEDVKQETRKQLQDCLVMVHGGMAQDVGPILEMVTEKDLLRVDEAWEARQKAICFFDGMVEKLKHGNIQEIARFTHENFIGPIKTIIPWTSNLYTESLIHQVQQEFKEDFWGFWMMGGMSGGGMGFIFHPEKKELAKRRLGEIMKQTKKRLEHAVPFAMEPVVYNFSINENGTTAAVLDSTQAMMPQGYYILNSPTQLKKELQQLSRMQICELENLSTYYKANERYTKFITSLFERMIPQRDEDENRQQTLDELLQENGFDPEMHQQLKTDLKSGRIGLSQNRLPSNIKIEDVEKDEIEQFNALGSEKNLHAGIQALKNHELAIVSLAGGLGSRWTKGAGVVKSLNPFTSINKKHRNFIEIHLAKNQFVASQYNTSIPHIFTTSYLTHSAIEKYLISENYYGFQSPLYLSRGKVVGLRTIPTERDLRYMWEEMPQQILDEQAQKVRESLHNALINWARHMGEAEDYTDNLPYQCIHPVGHWYEIPNLFLNGTLQMLLQKTPSVKYLLVHNIDTLGANADPAVLGYHINTNSDLTAEVITRRLDDRGGGLAKIDGKIRLIEGMALPNEHIEFQLSYYNTNTFWISIQKLLDSFQLTRADLNSPRRVQDAVNELAHRMPTYITLKDVKKRWGKGQEDIFPVAQFEKLWGDMTAIPELNCKYLEVSRMRGQQLKDVSQLDGWLRDGSYDYIRNICKWNG